MTKPPPQNDRDQIAFMRLYMQHQQALLSAAVSIVGDLSTAEDITQEASMVMWRKFGELDSVENFARWSFGIMRMELLRFRRDRARDRMVFEPALIERLIEDFEADSARRRERQDALRECLQKLQPASQQLVQLRYLRGLEAPDVAAKLEIGISTLYRRLATIREQLLHCVESTTGNASSNWERKPSHE